MKHLLLKSIYWYFRFFTHLYLRKKRPYVIGITGSVGKTSCRMILTQMFEKFLTEKVIYTSPKNFNSEIGLVLSIFQIDKYNGSFKDLLGVMFKILKKGLFESVLYDVIVLEYGIDHPGDMKFLTSIVRPDISIFTQLDGVHSEYFGSKEAIGDEKFFLMKQTKELVYLNAFDDYSRVHAGDLKQEVKFFNADSLLVTNYRMEHFDENLIASFKVGDLEIQSNTLGEENAYYIALGTDILHHFGFPFEEKKLFVDITIQPGRFSVFMEEDNVLIDSTYNAAPKSMEVMIKNTKQIRDMVFPEYKIAYVIGDMRELGSSSREEHEKLASSLMDADCILLVGKDTIKFLMPKIKESGFDKPLEHFRVSRKAGEYLKENILGKGDKYVVLFKGSQNTIFMEEALKVLLADRDKRKTLVRQTPEWIVKKEEFFITQ